MRLIDADALTNDILRRWNTNDDTDFANKEVWRALEGAPTIDVEPVRHGRWIKSTTDIICSKCGTVFNDEVSYMCRDFFYGNPRYCPYCGAKMDE